MPDRRNPEIAQIVGRQPPQNFTVNVVITERERVLFEPQTAKPLYDIHWRCPEAAT